MVFAEDQQLIRESLRFLLAEDPELVIEALASGGREAVELCRDLKPDLILLDIQMPDMNGFEAADSIRRTVPDTKIVFLTTFADRETVRRSLDFGADGFLLKDIHPELFIQALKSIASGLVVYQPELKQYMSHCGQTAPESRELPFGLTPRDREYIRYIVEGMGNKEIARIDGCSEGTVKNRVSGILNKLSLEVRTQIAVFAVRNNLLDDETSRVPDLCR